MRKYRLHCAAVACHGTQTYTVMAKNEADAIKRHKNGDSEFECEEIEVMELGPPDVELVDEGEPPC